MNQSDRTDELYEQWLLALIEELQVQLAAERKDAERYRLVRLLPGNEELMSLLESICAEPTSPEQFDATIDAARKKRK
mgnify:CR=1 FL=1